MVTVAWAHKKSLVYSLPNDLKIGLYNAKFNRLMKNKPDELLLLLQIIE